MNNDEFTLKGFTMHMDGHGCIGTCLEINLPDLATIEKGYRAGGMDFERSDDMGMEPLEMSFVLKGQNENALKLFGVSRGAEDVPFVFRGALQHNDDTVVAARIEASGRVTKVSSGKWAAGETGDSTVTIKLDYYKRLHDDKVIHEICNKTYKRVIDGVDQLEKIRKALAM